MTVIMVQMMGKNKGPRTPNILAGVVSDSFSRTLVGSIYLLYRRSIDNLVRPKVNVEVIRET